MVQQRKIGPHTPLGPLGLLTLAACGGGGGGGSTPTVSSSSSTTISGTAVAGPIDGAIAFVDYDEDGLLDVADEPYAYTDSDGDFSLTSTDADAPIVVTTDSATAGGLTVSAIDTSSDTGLSGVTLKAPAGSTVVSPTSTVAYDLIKTNGLTEAQVATALGLDGVSILSFNPYASGVDASAALAVEKVASQVMTTVKAVAAAAEGAGADAEDAANEAFSALVTVVQTKTSAGQSIDLINTTDLASVKTQAATNLATASGIDATAFNTILDTTMDSVKLINDAIKAITDTDLTSSATKGVLATSELLKTQAKAAATAEAASEGSGAASITLTDASTVSNAATAAANNAAPTDISLSATTIAENSSSLTFTATSTDDSSSSFTYALSGTDASYFNLNSSTGVLTLKASPDYETKTSYAITLKTADDAAIPKSYSEDFTISVTDVNEAPGFSVSSATGSVAENADASTVIFTASASDPDTSKSIVYSITGGDDASLVQIDSSTGEVVLREPADRETNPAIDFIVTAADASNSALASTQSVSVTVSETNELPTAINKSLTITENTIKTFSSADFGISDPEGDSLSKIKIVAIHESAAGQLKLGGTVVSEGDEITASNLSSLTYTPGNDEIGDAYARISFKVNDGNNYSEAAGHVFLNVEEAALTSSSSLALTASSGSSGQSYRLLSESTGSTELDNLMTGSGWARADGNYGNSSEIYLTFSFNENTSSYSYLTDAQEALLSSISATGRDSIRGALNQVEKFTNLNFIEVEETSSTFGDIRFTEAALPGGLGGLGFFPAWGNSMESDKADINGDVLLSSSLSGKYATSGSEANYIVMHEIGHALGLSHPFHAGEMNPAFHYTNCACPTCCADNQFVLGSNNTQGSTARDSSVYSVMSYGFSQNGNGGMTRSDPTSSTYMVDDVRALQHLYGTDTSFSSGNNIYDYSFFASDNSGFIKSIYDYAGTDTFDFTNQNFETRGILNSNDYLFLDGNPANGAVTSTSDSDILNLQNFEGVLGMANSYIEQFFGGDGSDEITAGSSGSVLFGGFASRVVDALTAGSGYDKIVLHDSGFLTAKDECDVVTGFDVSSDKFALEGGLAFSDLTFEDVGSDCYVKNSVGSYLIKVNGVSSSGLSSSQFETTSFLEKSLGILENSAPEVLAGSTFKVETTSKIVGYVSSRDSDNDALHYSLVETGDYLSASINKSNGLITLNNNLTDGQSISLMVEVSDGIAKASKNFTITGTTDSGSVSTLDREIEDNGSISNANAIQLNKDITGNTSAADDQDYFKITASSYGTITLNFSSSSNDGLGHNVSILSAAGEVLSKKIINGDDSLSAEILSGGSYYALVNSSLDVNNYKIKASYSSDSSLRETEPNNSIATADAINSGASLIGQSSSLNDVDYYSIVASGAGVLAVDFTGDGTNSSFHDISILDASENVIAGSAANASDTITAKISSAGTYYIKVGNSSDTSDYTVSPTFTETSSAREAEPNNTTAAADAITSGVAIAGQTSNYSDKDYYVLSTAGAGTISVTFTGVATNYSYHSVSIIDANSNLLASDRFNGSATLSAEISSSGNYYVLVDNSFDTEDYSLTATYSSTTGARETESNNTIATADTISSGTAIAGQASSLSDDDYYKIVLSAAGTISVAFSDGSGSTYRDHDVSIVDASGNVLAKESIYEAGTVSTEVGSSGNYYVLVDNSYDTDDYSLTATYSSTTGARETESNNTIATADTISSGTAIAGQASSLSDDDYYKIVLSAAGTISVAFSDGSGSTYRDHDVSIVDASGNVLAKESIYEAGTVSTEVGSSGNYFVLVDNSYDTKDYSLTATYSSTTGARETESNNTIATADTISSGTAIAGQASSLSDDDYYKIVLSAAGTISVAFSDGSGSTYRDHDVSIVDASGNILAKKSIYESGTVTAEVGASGNYFVLVDNSYDTEDYSLTTTYSSTTGARETESNNTIATADTISSGTAIAGQASSLSDDDYYKIVLSAAGTISVAFSDGNGSTYRDHDVSIVDASGNILAKKSIYESGTVTAEVGASGNYFVLVDNSYDTEDYSLTTTYSSTTGARETESNNTIATADTISSGTAIAGQASSLSDDDYYKIVLSAAGTISVAFSDGSGSTYRDHDVSIVDASGNILAKKSIYESGTVTAEVGASGNYFVLVDNSYDTEDYSLTTTYSSTTGAREIESNDTYANQIASGTAIAGQTSSLSDDDWYYMALSAAGTISVAFNDGNGSTYRDHDVSIVDASGNILAKKSIYESGTVTAEVGSSGNYFVLIDNSYDTEDYSLTTTYSSTTGARETEANNTIATADLLSQGIVVTGQTSSTSDSDYFKADITTASTARFTFTSDGSNYSDHTITLFNSAGGEITSGKINGNTSIDLTFAEATTIYGAISNSYDQEDYSIRYDLV